MLTAMFKPAKRMFPVFMSCNVSKLNVEKVLNPPQNPIIIKGFNQSFPSSFGKITARVTPNAIQLKRFDNSVATGKIVCPKVTTNFEIP